VGIPHTSKNNMDNKKPQALSSSSIYLMAVFILLLNGLKVNFTPLLNVEIPSALSQIEQYFHK
jgi:hypothetical protein